MKRYPAFDPPEYVNWTPDPDVLKNYRNRIAADPERQEIIAGLQPEEYLRLYTGMLRNRLFDIMLKRWVRQGVISKAWLGTGEEATTIGAVHALRRGDLVGPMIRNAGAYHEMGISLADMLRAYLATADSPTEGRDFHLGSLDHGVVAPISMVGALVPVCAGAALAFKIRGQDQVALTWAGDGTTRTTDFHEGLMCARAMKVPLIVIIQDNQIALGTTHAVHSRASMDEAAAIYGIPGYSCDGNHVLDVFAATSLAREDCRAGRGPVILTAKTFRMGGHATHDEGDSRDIFPSERFDYWGRRDPIGQYEAFVKEAELRLSQQETNEEALKRIEADVIEEVDRAAEEARSSRELNMPRPESQQRGVFA